MTGETQDIERYLSVGSAGILHTEPHRKDGPRYKTTIRGWQKGSYVMLDMPADDELALVRGQPCVVRFVARGEACGFDARAQNWGCRIHPYFRVEWPSHIEVVSVRKYERIEANLPCTVALDDESSLEGEIRDLSAGGCSLFLSEAQPVGSRLRASFKLPDGTNIENLECVVRNARPNRVGAFHGCEFEGDPGAARNDLEFFVSTTLERMRVTTRASQRVLFIEGEPEDVAVLQGVLQDRGYGVTVASGLVAGFHRLRMSAPRVLLLNWRQKDLSGLEICAIVRATRGFEDLPVFLYGGEDPSLEEQALKAGATQYFPSITMTERIADEVFLYMGDAAPAESEGPKQS